MSLVRISKELINDVERVVEGIKERDYAATVEPLKPTFHTEMNDQLYEIGMSLLWKEHRHFMDMLPAKWMPVVERMDLTIRDPHGNRIMEEIQISRKTKLPPGTTHSYNYVEVKVPVAMVSPEFKAAFDKYDAASKALKEKYHAIRQQVCDFLMGCKSLNDALRKFPDIALYVPLSYIDRVEEVVERKARALREKIEANNVTIDRDMISAVGVLGKLQGG